MIMTSTIQMECRMRCFIHLFSTDLSWFKYIIFHSFVYKLTDFGAARELEAHEGFMSVYGTEEYLVGQILPEFFLTKINTVIVICSFAMLNQLVLVYAWAFSKYVYQ